MAVRALTALALATLVVAINDISVDSFFAGNLPSPDNVYLATANTLKLGPNNTVLSSNASAPNDSSDFDVAKLDGDFSSDLQTVSTSSEVENDTDGEDIIYELTDEEYYEMPELFELDEYRGCRAKGGVYCRGSFELIADGPHTLLSRMKRYSANFVHNFNHTRVHRGMCLTRRCGPRAARNDSNWFAGCVNDNVMAAYNLSAHMYHLDYCVSGPEEKAPPLDTNQTAFAGLVGLLIVLTTLSTTLDLILSDPAKKSAGWMLSWSLRQSWRALVAPPSSATDLIVFDGLRIFCLMCVIIEHVCWVATLSYISNIRSYEKMRLDGDVILMTNSTLVVQIFFLMASFLLANKLLQQKRQHLRPIRTFFHTMFNRIIRISPSYFFVVWFAASWWERLGSGPQWAPLVGGEAAVCRKKWWTQLLYLNNLVYANDKCLIQTWYLAADMQLYALALALTLVLSGRRLAIPILAGLFAAVTVFTLGLSYVWELVPTLIVHTPESVRVKYSGNLSFNTLYQSPLGNAAGMLAGLLLAHVHHSLKDKSVLTESKVFRWVSVLSAPASLWWAGVSPMMLGEGPPDRIMAAVLAAIERPVFILFVGIALLGAINGIHSPWRSWFASGSAVFARLSFGALLLHIPINEALQGARLAPAQLDRQNAILEWFGVAFISYAAAVPLALLVEFPVMRLHRELTARRSTEPSRPRLSSHTPLDEKARLAKGDT